MATYQNSRMKIVMEDVAFHRNGVCGEGFYVATFTAFEKEELPVKMVGIIFPEVDEEGRESVGSNPRVSVFDRALVGQGEIRFAFNSWRGDVYSDLLWSGVKEWQREQGWLSA